MLTVKGDIIIVKLALRQKFLIKFGNVDKRNIYFLFK